MIARPARGAARVSPPRASSPRVELLGPALLALAAFVALGCGKRSRAEAVQPNASATAPVTATSALPADHALPGELAEGAERAFGLALPRRMNVSARFPDAVFAGGEVAPELVANFVRERVVAAQVDTGPTRTVFLRATTKSEPGRMLRIDVIARGAGVTDLFIRDETRAPAAPGRTPEERWRQLGFAPDGTPLDLKHLE
jgi:hypothetical protein